MPRLPKKKKTKKKKKKKILCLSNLLLSFQLSSHPTCPLLFYFFLSLSPVSVLHLPSALAGLFPFFFRIFLFPPVSLPLQFSFFLLLLLDLGPVVAWSFVSVFSFTTVKTTVENERERQNDCIRYSLAAISNRRLVDATQRYLFNRLRTGSTFWPVLTASDGRTPGLRLTNR